MAGAVTDGRVARIATYAIRHPRAVAAALCIAACSSCGGEDVNGSAVFDARNLKAGRFTYEITHDSVRSRAVIEVFRRSDGQYVFTADFPAFAQSWRSVAKQSMAPVQTTLQMRTRDGLQYQLNLEYLDRRVTGRATTSASPDGAKPRVSALVEDSLPELTVDQRIDWATAMSADLAGC